MSKEPKKVRGLSLLQKRIMAVAAKGWITPDEARTCAYRDYHWDFEEPLKMLEARVAASASRALRRLVQRNVLILEPSQFLNQSSAYRLAGWTGALPWLESRHTRMSQIRSAELRPSPTVATLNQFDEGLADRHKRLDTSLTKAEIEIGKRLNRVLTEDSRELLRQAETALATAAGIPLPEDVSVDEGRAVLVGILNRQRLTSQKELQAVAAK
jgi:hypothetical protein